MFDIHTDQPVGWLKSTPNYSQLGRSLTSCDDHSRFLADQGSKRVSGRSWWNRSEQCDNGDRKLSSLFLATSLHPWFHAKSPFQVSVWNVVLWSNWLGLCSCHSSERGEPPSCLATDGRIITTFTPSPHSAVEKVDRSLFFVLFEQPAYRDIVLIPWRKAYVFVLSQRQQMPRRQPRGTQNGITGTTPRPGLGSGPSGPLTTVWRTATVEQRSQR